ncbi:polyisoprenoid-binding protein [bacterium CG_4_9_14_3_um_filter_65_15]|nr:MAG: polyisoprenoid-binding protein [bacterium CG_4_9_14_3_um_filter_65_15]
MKARIAGGAAVLAILVVMAGASLAAEYSIDNTHSEIGFQVRHLAISKVNGKFASYAGSFNFAPDKPQEWTAEVTIDVASIDTDNTKRDDHLRSPDFFDAEKFPQISFKSTGVTMSDDSEGTVTGGLTMRGVTKPVTLDLEFLGAVVDPWGNQRAGFSLSGTIDRQDWGLSWSQTLETGGLVVSDKVKLMIDVEGIQAK